jgi:hypothetical protein
MRRPVSSLAWRGARGRRALPLQHGPSARARGTRFCRLRRVVRATLEDAPVQLVRLVVGSEDNEPRLRVEQGREHRAVLRKCIGGNLLLRRPRFAATDGVTDHLVDGAEFGEDGATAASASHHRGAVRCKMGPPGLERPGICREIVDSDGSRGAPGGAGCVHVTAAAAPSPPAVPTPAPTRRNRDRRAQSRPCVSCRRRRPRR